VGLVSVNVEPLLPVCRVSPPDVKILKGTPVVSVGCSGGEKPTKQALKITATDRYELGADNIEIGGMPAQGRSGGGLFMRDGQLIGVCSGADSHYREGLYVGPRTVHNLLARCQLAHLCGGRAAEDQNAINRSAGGLKAVDAPEVGASRCVGTGEAAVAAAGRIDSARAPSRDPADARPAAAASDDETLREALEQAGAAEVVCIIRPINQPRAASRVVILNRASSRFVSYLSDEIDTQPAIRETTLTTRERRTDAVQKVRRPVSAAGAAATAADPALPVGPQAYRRKR